MQYMLKNPSALREEIADLEAKALSICDLAEADERSMTAAEQREFESIVGTGKPGERNYNAGQLGQLRNDLDHAEKREAIQAGILNQRARDGEITFGDAPSISPVSWRGDSRGNRFAVLNKGERVSSLIKPVADHAFGHFVCAKIFGPNKATPEPIRNALSESQGVTGGFLVPEQMSGSIIDLARAKSVLTNAGMRTIVMESESLKVPKLEEDIEVDLKGENESATFGQVSFGQRTLNVHTAVALTSISRELWEDSPTLLAEQMDNWIGRAMAVKIDKYGIEGHEGGRPVGLLNTDAIASTGSVGAIDWSDVAAAVTTIRNNNHEPNAVVMHPTIHDDLFNIETGDGTNAARGWLEAPPTIRGKQFEHTTNCPLANLVVGDFSKYVIGLRTGAQVEASTSSGEAFKRHQVHVKITMRFDFTTLDDTAFHNLTGITS